MKHSPISNEISEHPDQDISGQKPEVPEQSNMPTVLGRHDLHHQREEAEAGHEADGDGDQPQDGVADEVWGERTSEVTSSRKRQPDYIGLNKINKFTNHSISSLSYNLFQN